MTSDVQARTRAGTTLYEVFAALFPCGSVTGAPKVQAMRMLRALEPQPRGIYCGALGIVQPGGRATFNVPIRTVVLTGAQARCGIGSGVVADSAPDAEWHEWQHKRAFLDRSSAPFDLLETFNWLLGLTVQHIAAPRSFAADFERDGEGRLHIKGRLKQDAAGPWWFRTVTGTTPEGRKTLIIWRKLTGNAEQDNLVLETWFRDKQAFSVRDTEFDLIYVNGDNTLENIRLDDESWKVRLTEEDFQRLMFEGTD